MRQADMSVQRVTASLALTSCTVANLRLELAAHPSDEGGGMQIELAESDSGPNSSGLYFQTDDDTL